MNANTALKIREAVEQAVRCGESEDEIRATFDRALDALDARRAKENAEKLGVVIDNLMQLVDADVLKGWHIDYRDPEIGPVGLTRP
jgi:hypothetical protein